MNFSRKYKKGLILLAAFGVSGYGVYKVYNLEYVTRKRQRVVRILGALFRIIEMVSDSAETIGVVSRDLKEFLESDSDQIPNSLKQLSKIARCEEFSESLSRVSEAVALGVLRGYRLESVNAGNVVVEEGKSGFVDGVLDKLTSKAGTGFVSVVVGSFAKNLVLAFQASSEGSEGLNGSKKSGMVYVGLNSSKWVDLLCDERCKTVMADSIQTFVRTAVAVYLDRTASVNIYDDMFSALTNPKYRTQMRDVLVSVCNGAVETLVKTSHQVLTSSKTNSAQNSNSTCSVEHSGAQLKTGDELFEQTGYSTKLKEKNSFFDIQNNPWVTNVSSTLAVPSNRKFVLDMTGRVTFETMRSLVEFVLRKLMDGLRRSFNVIHQEVLGRGLEVIQYVGAKSSVIVTICLALYLHMLGGTRAFLPA